MSLKTLLTFLGIAILSHGSLAQITLSQANSPAIGDTSIYGVDTVLFLGFTSGTPGANQVYDYSNLVIHYHDTVIFMDPALTPYGADYPQSNVARIDQDDSALYYWRIDSNKIDITGMVDDSYHTGYFLKYHYVPFKLNLSYPSTYNTYHPNTVSVRDITVPGAFVGEPHDSVRRKLVDNRTIIFDGWGTLILASGTYPCLRESRQDFFTDSVWTKTNPGNWVLTKHTTKSRNTVRFYSHISNDPMMRIKYNNNNVLTSVYFLINPILFPGMEKEQPKVSVKVFPSPADNQLYVLHNAKGARIKISDVSGRIVYDELLDENVQVINCSGFSAGSYHAVITGEDQSGASTSFLISR